MTSPQAPPPLPSTIPAPAPGTCSATDGWHYSHGGQRRGPVTIEVLRQLYSSGELSPSDLVWQQGMPEWVLASAAGIATDPALPPPLPGSGVSNGAAWTLVIALPIAFLVALTIANIHPTPDASARDGIILLCTIAAAATLLVVDVRRVRKAGHRVGNQVAWAVVCFPVYLFKRSRALNQGHSLLVAHFFMIALFVVLAAVAASAEKGSSATFDHAKALADQQKPADAAQATEDQQAPADAESKLSPVQRRDEDVKALLKAMDDQGESKAAMQQMQQAIYNLENQGEDQGMDWFRSATHFYPTFELYKNLFVQVRNDEREVRKVEAEAIKNTTPMEKRGRDEQALIDAVSGGGLEETKGLVQAAIASLENGDIDTAVAMFNKQAEQHEGLAGFKAMYMQLVEDERAVRADPSYKPSSVKPHENP